MPTPCTERNNRGEPCGAYAVAGSTRCFVHAPEKAAERVAARRLGGRNRQTAKGSPPPATVRLRTLEDVQRLLETLASDTLLQENSARRTTAAVSVLALAMKALETGALEERLAAVESALRPRRVA